MGPVTDGQVQARLAALRLANDVRAARAQLKRQIADGIVSAAETLLDPPAPIAGCPVGELLMSQPRWGRTKCIKFLARNAISERKPIRELTDRQRELLAAQLR